MKKGIQKIETNIMSLSKSSLTYVYFTIFCSRNVSNSVFLQVFQFGSRNLRNLSSTYVDKRTSINYVGNQGERGLAKCQRYYIRLCRGCCKKN